MVSIKRTSKIFKVGFALSKGPHFHSAYVVRVYIFFATAVLVDSLPARIGSIV